MLAEWLAMFLDRLLQTVDLRAIEKKAHEVTSRFGGSALHRVELVCGDDDNGRAPTPTHTLRALDEGRIHELREAILRIVKLPIRHI